jgi:cold shock CspA family protein
MTKDVDKSGWVYGEPTIGIVVRTVHDRGFVFVRAGEVDYFLHFSDYADGEFLKLIEKTEVSFTPVQTPTKGPRAVKAERAR